MTKGTVPRTGAGHRPEERPPPSFRYPRRLVRFYRDVSYSVSESALRSMRLMFFVDFVNYDDDVPPVITEVTLEALVSDQSDKAWQKFSSHLAVPTGECWDLMSPSESSNSCLPSIKGFACGKFAGASVKKWSARLGLAFIESKTPCEAWWTLPVKSTSTPRA